MWNGDEKKKSMRSTVRGVTHGAAEKRERCAHRIAATSIWVQISSSFFVFGVYENKTEKIKK